MCNPTEILKLETWNLKLDCGDTIAAISSAVGAAARMILRLSGPRAIEIAGRLGVDSEAQGGGSFRCPLSFSELVVPAWVYLFRAPRSYSGEDLVELHLPGNPALAKMVLEELLRAGARAAEPGEFTARAYFNGRIDLTGAEGVAATIAAGNEQELLAARQLLAGELARRLAEPMEWIAGALALVEAGIDFSEEDVSFLSTEELTERIDRIDRALKRLLEESSRFERLAHEPRVALVGRPNAGKSTLLNALAGRERAVVSPLAGTTRDVLSADVVLPRGIVRVTDAAGVEQSPDDPTDATNELSQKMRRHALRALEEADVVVLVQDVQDARPRLELGRVPSLVVRSKADMWHSRPRLCSAEGGSPQLTSTFGRTQSRRAGTVPHGKTQPRAAVPQVLDVSALCGAGMDCFRQRLDALCFGESAASASVALNLRHVQAIEGARAALRRAADAVPSGRPELLALELREALDHLGEVVGRVSPDELLGRIFSTFCIGK